MKIVVSLPNKVAFLACVAFLTACSSESAETLADMHPGQSTYTEACISCHNPGIGGAPRMGDADAWQPRAAKGRQALVNSTINGLNGMPAKGMCWQCSDEQLGHAVDYMLDQAGVTATP